MEQPGSPPPTIDLPEAVSEVTTTKPPTNNQRTPQAPTRGATTSNSVPTLRFPRPVGNRRLTNWVSSSQPDIMRPSNFPDDAPLDASITDDYEVIGTDGETQPGAADSIYERPASELGDDVHSLADTDTGTDAYTNDVDTDSSDDDDDEEEDEELDADHTAAAPDDSAVLTDEEDHEVDMTMAERSLEHPTELFTPDSIHVSRQASTSGEDYADSMLERALSAAGLTKGRASANSTGTAKDNAKETHPKLLRAEVLGARHSIRNLYEEAVEFFRYDTSVRQICARCLFLTALIFTSRYISQYMTSDSTTATEVLTTVPVASVSSIATPSTAEILISTSTVTSIVTSTKIQSHALQTTTSSKSVASIAPDSSLHVRQNLCSADVHGRNEILLRVPQQFKTSWLAKHAVMISVSRGSGDVSSEFITIADTDEGFIIEVPHEEAYGILDVSIATTRKPKIKETFQVNFGSFIIVDALDAGKQLMKGFAQTVVDTLNGTTTWVEETCSPAFDLMSKPASVTDSIMQGFQDATSAAFSLPGQLADLVKQPFPEGRVEQARKELARTAQDLQDEATLLVLHAQLNSKLQWLWWSGQTAEYEQYLAAAGPYYQKKQQEAAIASHARANSVKKEIQARRKLETRQGREARGWAWGAFERCP
ncbi:hypothetical protein SUNI508_06072 [Seiridium unicorne]|uniref:Uncharacterized protein n=1 Tax=Seiridium unicorne TaxID=138068 RepID=A0ABR2V337_9PEZI